MRAVFLHSSAPGAQGSPPLGSGCIAAALIDAGLLDPAGTAFLDAGGEGEGSESLLERILAHAPELVGFSLYLWNSLGFEAVAQRLRKSSPDLILIAGGPDAERLSGAEGSPFDAVFTGEAEAAAVRWLQGRAEGREPAASSIRCPPPRLESLPSPWTSGLLKPSAGSSLAWELARGCPFRCAYCYEGRGIAGLRILPMGRIEKELKIFAAGGIARVFVLDPTFNADKARALRLLRLLEREGGNIHWDFEVRAELLDEDQARAFSRLDCSLQIGLQSSNPKALGLMRRSLDRRKFREKLAMLDEWGIIYGLDLIYGLPGDSLEDFRLSLDFALSLAPNHLDIFPLALIPGTEFHARKAELGLNAPDEPPYILIGSPDFPPEAMAAASLLAEKARVFYTEGRAVPWFRAVLEPLELGASVFFDGLESDKLPRGAGHEAIEAFQCAALEAAYARAGKPELVPGALDLVRFHGAWSRAFAEGVSSVFQLHYPSELVESAEMLDLEAAVYGRKPRPRAYRMAPGKDGPRLLRISPGAASGPPRP